MPQHQSPACSPLADGSAAHFQSTVRMPEKYSLALLCCPLADPAPEKVLAAPEDPAAGNLDPDLDPAEEEVAGAAVVAEVVVQHSRIH